MSKEDIKKFIRWNKRVFADDRPIFAWGEQKDEEGYKESFTWFMGSCIAKSENPNKRVDFGQTIGMLNNMRNQPHPHDRRISKRQEESIKYEE